MRVGEQGLVERGRYRKGWGGGTGGGGRGRYRKGLGGGTGGGGKEEVQKRMGGVVRIAMKRVKKGR